MIVKAIYKTIRSIIFTLTLLVVGLYVLTYTLFSIPAFTDKIKTIASNELSKLLGGRVEIEGLEVFPFNEVQINNINLFDPSGKKCLEIETIGAGIRLWKLLTELEFEFTYGEVIGLNALITQKEKNGELNIDFIIKALSRKDDGKEKKAFELALKNVVLRKSSITFRRDWMSGTKIGALDLGCLQMTDLAADITFPKISSGGIDIDLRRLSLSLVGITDIEKIAFKGKFSPEIIDISNFILNLPASRIFIPEILLKTDIPGDFKTALSIGNHDFKISESHVCLSDFSHLFPFLQEFNQPLEIALDASGNLNAITVKNFNFGNPELISVNFTGGAEEISDFNNTIADLSDLNIFISSFFISKTQNLFPSLPEQVKHMVKNAGDLDIKGNFSLSMPSESLAGNLEMSSDVVRISAEGGVEKSNNTNFNIEGELTIEDLRLHELFSSSPFTNINANIIADIIITSSSAEGVLNFVLDDFEYKGKKFDGFSININKEGEFFNGDFLMQNSIAEIESKFSGDIEGEEKNLHLDMDLPRLNLSEIVDMKSYQDYVIAGTINLDVESSGQNSLEGSFNANNFSYRSPDNSKTLRLKQLQIAADLSDSINMVNLKSDWMDLRAEGPFKIKELPSQLKTLVASVFPSFIESTESYAYHPDSDLDFDIVIKKNNAVPEFFHFPVRLLVPVTISGTIQSSSNYASLTFDLPYLQQGRDKLIYDTKLVAEINGKEGILNAVFETNLPVKRGDLALNVNIFGQNDAISTDLRWVNTENSDFKAHIILDTDFKKNPFTQQPEISLLVHPSVLKMGTAEWNVNRCNITYADKTIDIGGLKVWHDDQFVEIKGIASPSFEDVVQVSLADIDVDYVFETLAINYVTFGGVATGEITGHALLSGNPVAETESLLIKEFSYNGASLGECKASSRWNNEEKQVEIGAEITLDSHEIVKAHGGIWLGKDSLSFSINADKVPVDFVQPFMSVFSSHVGGYATGGVKLFGTFQDIDMTGKIFADSVAVKLDYTNTIYHGSDSIFLHPGQIEIPNFRLYDKYGNSALLTGELKHRYFHDPTFTFRLQDADNFLCYDTNSDLNPDWYGTLFGTGSAILRGVPGVTYISADMTVSGSSNFTFVLNDTQYAQDYQFLTFSDRRKEANKQEHPPTPQDIKALLRKNMHLNEAGVSKFAIDIRASVTPQVLFTLVMDPAAGDKITARGRGAMQVKYESDNDEMMMYGKYEIAEGNYNFSLQDIILRDFKIKEGSYITFNGNPLAADLDISATYRVNTNLSDLDKSFSTDRDLNRTNVPVDAVLSVNGPMMSPDITFDIELPTLTQDVERKVKSIISTDDMMNRQIIYLLALNRFYTPEYMGNSGNGGELAAMASSTISSQLSNILGQLTDKFSVSPSFRSDKGDFSDIEVDVALSSRLLNNRLLINGNFGYRDRSNSSTTFVGDFDVEYLLSKSGNLRLKAYNHFNDQNYYLREALTTQGLGIVYRRDFDHWFTFLKKKRKKEDPEITETENTKE